MSEAKEEDVASYFLNLWRQASKSSRPGDETDSEGERSPTALDTEKSSFGFAVVGPDKLSVSYPHVGIHTHDVGVVQANRAAPWKRLLYYFEVLVKRSWPGGRISIGFSTSSFDRRHHPGWEAHSWGYHGVDGLLYRGHELGETFICPIYTTFDTVGCGVNNATQEFFFTKNGCFSGTLKKDVVGPVFPTIGLHALNDEVIVNFGNKPFVFDLNEYEECLRERQQKAIDEMEIKRCNGLRYHRQYAHEIPDSIVRSYLQHYGYAETLRLFDNAVETEVFLQEDRPNDDKLYVMNQRNMIRQMIMCGQVDDALTKLKEWFPQTMEVDVSPIRFFLHSQKFIELFREGKLPEAVAFSRSEFDKFRSVLNVEDQVQDCASLLVYEQPQKSQAGYLLEESHRELVANAVNATILSTNPNLKDKQSCMQSSVERLIRQVTACFSEHRALSGDQGEAFDLSRILESHKD